MMRSSEGAEGSTLGTVVDIQTQTGLARAFVHEPVGSASGVVVLGHGAGRGSDTADLLALAEVLPSHGLSVIRLDQPWVVAGRRVAPAPKTLDVGWLQAVPELQRVLGLDIPLIVGGRSAGARVACRTATKLAAVGVVALAFPGHPPGRPDRPRWTELMGTGVGVLVVQGERDPFGSAEDVRSAMAGVRPAVDVSEVAWADHCFRVAARAPVSSADALATVTQAVLEWCSKRIPH